MPAHSTTDPSGSQPAPSRGPVDAARAASAESGRHGAGEHQGRQPETREADERQHRAAPSVGALLAAGAAATAVSTPPPAPADPADEPAPSHNGRDAA